MRKNWAKNDDERHKNKMKSFVSSTSSIDRSNTKGMKWKIKNKIGRIYIENM
jgi:hypothetical protein